ncbi:immunoglobulin superfamily member 11-like isoform X2 [Branchiostoma lanceolatum]|uniref:immunoglobulin superfamily member 11-like isoform X2 n=1 Tax=Branchiostoma lanceolatum TaxID=7740 RepID=UPI0034571214
MYVLRSSLLPACLLLAFLHLTGAQNQPVVTVTNSGNVQVFRTETANLNCSFASTVPLTVQSVSWYKLNEDGTQGAPFLVYVTNSPIQADANRLTELGLTDRVSFQSDSTSITIQETAQPDTGTFRCEVDPIFPGGGVASSVDTNLTVVVLPQVTIAQLPLTAYVQEDVTLTCQSGSFPGSTYNWTRVDGAALPGGATFYEGYELVLPKAVLSDAGQYRCVADNGYGTDTGTYLLTLHDRTTTKPPTQPPNPETTKAGGDEETPKPRTTDSTGLVVGLVLGLLAAIVLAAGIIYYCRNKGSGSSKKAEKKTKQQSAGSQRHADMEAGTGRPESWEAPKPRNDSPKKRTGVFDTTDVVGPADDDLDYSKQDIKPPGPDGKNGVHDKRNLDGYV